MRNYMSDNGIFTITPPDMQLSENGPSITVISTDEKLIEDVEDLHETIFKNVPVNVYHPDGHVQDSNLAWSLSVMRLSDTVFVDLDTANELSILCAMISKANVVFIAGDNRPEVIKLLNSTDTEFAIYNSVSEYMARMLESLY